MHGFSLFFRTQVRYWLARGLAGWVFFFFVFSQLDAVVDWNRTHELYKLASVVQRDLVLVPVFVVGWLTAKIVLSTALNSTPWYWRQPLSRLDLRLTAASLLVLVLGPLLASGAALGGSVGAVHFLSVLLAASVAAVGFPVISGLLLVGSLLLPEPMVLLSGAALFYTMPYFLNQRGPRTLKSAVTRRAKTPFTAMIQRDLLLLTSQHPSFRFQLLGLSLLGFGLGSLIAKNSGWEQVGLVSAVAIYTAFASLRWATSVHQVRYRLAGQFFPRSWPIHRVYRAGAWMAVGSLGLLPSLAMAAPMASGSVALGLSPMLLTYPLVVGATTSSSSKQPLAIIALGLMSLTLATVLQSFFAFLVLSLLSVALLFRNIPR